MQFNNESNATASRWPRTDYMTSSQVTKTFMSITPHRIEVELWARCHCVCLVKAYRLICSSTYLGHSSGQVIWPDQRSNFQNDLLGPKCIWCVLTRGIRWCTAFFSIFVISKVTCTNVNFPEKQHFMFGLPWKDQMWPKVAKSGVVIFRTSRTFRLFLLRSSTSTRGQTSWGWKDPSPHSQVRSRMSK